MRFGSVCSGIEAASVAWEPLGWQAAWFSEIEPFPSAVLAHHYPQTPNLGDMTTLPERIRSGEVEAPDLFCGGTPCQAFSVAGLRRSLDDARGNLSLTFCEIANAIDHVRVARGEQPCIIFWENVPGVLSTKDNAFGCFLAGLAGEDGELEPPGGRWTDAGFVDGPQRAVAWRVLDAQYFGVAQRRRRVFVVASARDGFDPVQVLFEFEGVRRDTAPSRETRKVAPTIPSRSTAGGGLGTDFDCDGGVVQVCPTLRAGGNQTGGDRPPGTDVDTADSLIVTHSLRGEGFDASEDGTGRGTPLVPVGVTIHGTDGTARVASYSDTAQCLRARTPGNIDNSSTTVVQQPVHVPDVAGTMKACKDSGGWSNSADHAAAGYMVPVAHAFDARQSDVIQYGDKLGPLDTDGHSVAVAFAQNSRDEVRLQNGDGQIVGALAAEPGMKQTSYVAFQPRIARNGRGDMGDLVNALQAVMYKNQCAHCQAFFAQYRCAAESHGECDCPKCQGYCKCNEPEAEAICIKGAAIGRKPEAGPQYGETLTEASYTLNCVDQHGVMTPAMQVRRLTPVECERLQGFPDDYTLIPWRGKPADQCPDGPRYKALGNSWAVPVVRWIGARIDCLANLI